MNINKVKEGSTIVQNSNKPSKLKLNKKILLIIIVLMLLGSCVTTLTVHTVHQKRMNEIREKSLFEYEIKECLDDDLEIYQILLKINSIYGIETIKYTDQNTGEEIQLKAHGKMSVAIDYVVKDRTNYEFKIALKDKEEQTENFYFEIPRIKGNYTLVNGLYTNEPDLTGYVKENTRYLYPTSEDNLLPGNWITDDKPQNWYDYKNQKWANIYVETNGVESYFVWIPRYVYKKDNNNSTSGNQRMDVKFVNTYNEYIDGETGKITEWKELQEQGYQLPEAFSWENSSDEPLIIPGYWVSKYQLKDLGNYKIDYNLAASKEIFNLSNYTNNTTASKYTYAINGQIVYESESLEDYSFINGTPDQDNTINVTALDENGNIIGSMTKKIKFIQVNPPDLTGFDKDTTFYVYWDKEGKEHNEIPISQEPPKGWYNYTYSEWANIVTRNDGLESYFVWIPRYQYALDQTSKRSNVDFILGDGPATRTGFQVPEAFSWGDNNEKQLTGYWVSKYQLKTEPYIPLIDAQITAGSNIIRIGNITGRILTTQDSTGTTVDVPLKYEYYINGTKVHEGRDATENYIYTGLEMNTTYTINIIARNYENNEYCGAITKKIKTIEPYAPDLTGFNKDETFYVIYNEDGTEKERISIKEDMPSNWYDYSERKWANIVTTANGTESYFVWIPRYEYRILADRYNEALTNKRTDVNFITKDITNNNCTTGYKVPEAFTWGDGDGNDVELSGYWISKYQLKN